MKYWLYSAIERKIAAPDPRINYTASDQYRRVDVGDHLWFVTMRPKSHALLLFGRMTVGWIGGREDAARMLEKSTDELRETQIHIISDPSSTESYCLIDITEHAMALRFESTLGNNCLPPTRWPQALQTMRVLDAETISLLIDIWKSSKDT